MSTLSRRSVDAFVSRYATDGRVLDLGCGQSPYARWFPRRVGCDVAISPGVQVLASATELPFIDGCFDQIVVTEVLEHIRRPLDAIREMWRVLRPGGRVVLTTRFLYPIHSAPEDYFRYTRFGLLALFDMWEVDVLRGDLGAVWTVAQLAEMATAPWPRIARRPARAFLRVAAGFAARFVYLLKDSGLADAMISSGYVLVARKPGASRSSCPARPERDPSDRRGAFLYRGSEKARVSGRPTDR
ncbi:MAG: class I SAM-dependent methyltransferase [Planctomycetota bacterium]